MKRITIFDEEIEYDIPTNPKEFIEYFEEKISLIPDEYKDIARITLEPSSFYDSSVLNLEISYQRIENNEEFKKREQKFKDQQKLKENQELIEFERLKKKFNQQEVEK